MSPEKAGEAGPGGEHSPPPGPRADPYYEMLVDWLAADDQDAQRGDDVTAALNPEEAEERARRRRGGST